MSNFLEIIILELIRSIVNKKTNKNKILYYIILYSKLNLSIVNYLRLDSPSKHYFGILELIFYFIFLNKLLSFVYRK